MSANPYEPPHVEPRVNAADVQHGYRTGYTDGYERALKDIVSGQAVRAANDALWSSAMAGVADALRAVARVLTVELEEKSR
jgi:hypothetical protein